MGKPGEKFPGLEAIKNRVPTGGKRGAPRKDFTPEQLAAMSPADRDRILRRRQQDGMTKEGPVPSAGRTPILTVELIAEVAKQMASGAPVERVCGSMGIARETVRDWQAKGRDPKLEGSIYQLFVDSVARAHDTFMVGSYAVIAMGGSGWQGRAWLAERLDPKALGPAPRRLEHSGPGGGGIRIVASAVELPEERSADDPALLGAGEIIPGYSNGHAGTSARLDLPDEDPEE